ncbi:MAG TPA: beta-N-acetylhexosaminidase, partial [Lachnospiraceae bacterium]|nr:beta-N-acetylhexosaminidase [Lachnospiraceae bacterium]
MMDKKFTILPRPYEIKREKGDFLLSGDTVIRIGSISEETDNSARYLKERIEEAAGFCLDIRPLCQKEEGGIELKKDERLSYPESYRLTVTESCIRITGADEAGLFYGVVTLSLIMEQNGAAIPCCSIEDGPRFAVRGIYIDAARGQVMKIESLKKMADFCARYKINQIQIYIQNTYAFEEMEEAYLLTTPYTPEEIREFVLYCRRLHIECVPSLALLGHMYEILNTYAFRKFCTLDADPAE